MSNFGLSLSRNDVVELSEADFEIIILLPCDGGYGHRAHNLLADEGHN